MSRHGLDAVSLVAGLIFTTMAVAFFALQGSPDAWVGALRWIVPGLLVVVGVVLLIGTGRGRGSDEGGE